MSKDELLVKIICTKCKRSGQFRSNPCGTCTSQIKGKLRFKSPFREIGFHNSPTINKGDKYARR